VTGEAGDSIADPLHPTTSRPLQPTGTTITLLHLTTGVTVASQKLFDRSEPGIDATVNSGYSPSHRGDGHGGSQREPDENGRGAAPGHRGLLRDDTTRRDNSTTSARRGLKSASRPPSVRTKMAATAIPPAV
jgi:hypothetical protein